MGSVQEMRFDGRVAIVTGAGAGLGRGYALLLASRGAKVVVNDISEAGATETVRAITENDGTATACVLSVTEPANAQQIVDLAVDRYGSIDIIINNAGNLMIKSFDSYSVDDFRLCMASHFDGAWFINQAAWPHMKKQGYGRIINTSSSAIYGPPDQAAYCAAKAAVFGMTNALAVEGKDYGIQVNTLGPAAYSPHSEKTLKDLPEMLAWIKKSLPTWAVAPLAVWLAHESCPKTGQFYFGYGKSFGKMFLGETIGIRCASDDKDYNPEWIRDHADEASHESGYNVLNSMMEVAVTNRARLDGTLLPSPKTEFAR